jgi:hypothetical protein
MDDPKMMKAAREACLAKTNSNNEEMRRYERALLGRGFDDGWKARASAEDRPLTEAEVEKLAELIDPEAWAAIKDGRDAQPLSLWCMRRDWARESALRVHAALSRIRKEGE